ncbi:MAG: hypothetical protein KAY50_05980 [Chitinophagaceae bacterium]|nr:hypothetical protein [Chitinophagaceae bacterium]
MKKSATLIDELYSIRNKFGKAEIERKIYLLQNINSEFIKGKNALQLFYDTILFLIAYPENKMLYSLANQSLQKLEQSVSSAEKLQYSLYNSGVTKSSVCAAFSFEIVKWLRQKHPLDIRLVSFEAADEQIRSILTVVMQKVETEKMQETKAAWKAWIENSLREGEDLLDGFINIFENSTLRPEVKDELWNTIGINTEIDFSSHCSLSGKLVQPYFHRSIIRKLSKQVEFKPKKVKLTTAEAEQIIDSSRMILIRQLREIDPISFTYPDGVVYYHLQRGYSFALVNMIPQRQVPNDCYLGYTVFKNGLPVAYAGSWIMFDSSRIGLNVYPYYRGGESQYIFQLVLQVHAKVFGLKRFTVDAYQIGKENYDGIQSGAFWVYYKAGFRPIEKIQKELAAAEEIKIKTTTGYRSPITVLKKLADSRMELILNKNALSFDAVDLSDIYAAVLKKQYKNNRMLAEKGKAMKLATILGIKKGNEAPMNYILKNWALLLLYKEKELQNNRLLKKDLNLLFKLKAAGLENDYIVAMSKAKAFRNYLQQLYNEFH